VSRAGYVLTGGRSSRMGRDKALLPFRGTTLAGHVARQVSRAAGSAVFVGNPQSYEQLGFPVIPDVYPGEGPLGGILTALSHTAAEWNLIAACDMPGISREFLRSLLIAAKAFEADALIPVNPVSGLAEPLCAVYRREARGPIEAAFGRGVRKVIDALHSDRLRLVGIKPSVVASFQNVNTPEEWACVDL